MGPLYFILARGSRAGCGHSLGGALRWEWVAFSAEEMDVSHVYMVSCGNRMARTRWGDTEGIPFIPCSIHPSPDFSPIQKHIQA